MALEHDVELVFEIRLASYGRVDGDRNVADEVQAFLHRYLGVHFKSGVKVQFKGMNFIDRSYLQAMNPAPIPQAHTSVPHTIEPSCQGESDTHLPGNISSNGS